MAIKITGTTVINDSRGLENFPDTSQIIKAPSITSPTDNETDVDPSLTITGTPYSALFSNTRDYREFEVDLATGDFSSPVVSQQVNSDSLTLSTDLDAETEHKVRIRDVDVDGNVSEFSDVVSFTTADPLTVAALGDSICGGFYMGTIAAAGTTYYLVVAPNATGCAECQWKTSSSSTSGTCSLVDGYGTTYSVLNNSTHPAGNWTATRTIDGFSDWYLPAIDELEVFYNNGGGNGSGDPLPSGEDFATTVCYWSSTEFDSSNACFFFFSAGQRGGDPKSNPRRARAVRRVPV